MSLECNRPYSCVFRSCTKYFYSFCNFLYDFDNNFRFSKNHCRKETTTGDLLTTLKSTLTCVNSLDQKPLLCTYCKTVKNNFICTSSLKEKKLIISTFIEIWSNLTFTLKKHYCGWDLLIVLLKHVSHVQKLKTGGKGNFFKNDCFRGQKIPFYYINC